MNSLPSITGEGSAVTAVASLRDYIQPTLGHGLRIWWAFYWRNNLIAIGLAGVLGIVVRAFYSAGILSLGSRAVILKAGPYVLAFLSAIFLIHYVVRKRFKQFRIGLLSNQGDAVGQELEPTRARTIRIWWTFTWRTAVYVIFLSIAANSILGLIVGLGAAISSAAGIIFALLVNTVLIGAASMFVIYSNILDEDIADFRVSLLPVEAHGVPEAPSSSSR
jgi:hypothetical protein